ncbi:hypothetical protein IBX84_02950 [Neisseria gonorrhoeae]|nr:hypothetical protein IBX84_02950 [Neisseria gonorrhoeae]
MNKPPRKKTVWRSTTSPASITADTVLNRTKEKACRYLQEAINNGYGQKSVLQELLQQWQNAV